MRKLLATVAVLTMPVLAGAGCGNQDEAASGASELVPAGAVVYGEANLMPEGDQKRSVEAILAKFPGGGQAGDKLKELIEKGLRESSPSTSFERDIEPWLGDEAAFFVTDFIAPAGKGANALLVATDDEDAALKALEKTAEGEVTHKSYNGVDYLQDQSDETNTAAVFDGFVVAGTEPGVKAAIDASNDGPTLSDDDGYKNSLEKAAEDRLGLIWVDVPEIVKKAEQTGAGALPESFKRSVDEPLVATVDADDDGVTVESAVGKDVADSFGGILGHGSELLDELPADSWAALAQDSLGRVIDIYVDAFAGMAGGRDAIQQQFQAATGLDLQRDVIDWMGNFGVFVRGTSVSALNGALVIETTDEAASGRFIAALERLAKSQITGPGDSVGPLRAPGGGEGFTVSSSDVPKPVHVFQRNGRVVFAYGDEAASDGAEARDKLGDSPDFSAARDSLGDYDVSFFVLVQPILDLVDSTAGGSDPDWRKAKPYLEPLNALVAGTSGDGDELRSAFKLIVK
jgi:Protein of unknown function (DUF3352)